jgi:imidazole glycerol phosphate synthase subunit HisF
VAVDDGHAVHYTAVAKGVPVYGSDEQVAGTVVEVLDNYREHIMDGIVFADREGVRRFVDGPEVGRTAERAVTLKITAAEAAQLPAPNSGSGLGGVLSKLFGGRRGG